MQSVNRNRPSNEIALQGELARLIAVRQHQISTGHRIEKPSEDPAAWTQISNIAKLQANMEGWLRNIDRGLSIANQAEGVISEINTQLTRANELLIQASSGTVSAENRETIALEMDNIGSILSDLLTQKNAFGRPLFPNNEPLDIPIDDQVYAKATPSTSAFATLGPLIANIATAIRGGDDTQRSAALAGLSLEADRMANILGQQGIAMSRFEQAKTSLQDRQIDVISYRSSLEDTDITVAITELQKLLVNQQAAQAIYARIEQSSLFDQLR